MKTVVGIMTGVNNEGHNTEGSPQPLLDLPSSAPVFHPRCGQLVTLSQASRTASRTHATQVGRLLVEVVPTNIFVTLSGVQPWLGVVCWTTARQPDGGGQD